MEPAIVLFIVLGIPALVIMAPSWMRARERQRILQALSAAADRGAALPPEHVSALLAGVHQVQRPQRAARPLQPDHVRDARRGVILLAVSLGFALIGLAVAGMVSAGGEEQWVTPAFMAVASIGAIPGMVGLAYLLLSRIGRRNGPADLDGG